MYLNKTTMKSKSRNTFSVCTISQQYVLNINLIINMHSLLGHDLDLQKVPGCACCILLWNVHCGVTFSYLHCVQVKHKISELECSLLASCTNTTITYMYLPQ